MLMRIMIAGWVLALMPTIALSKDKNASIEDAVRDEVRKEVGLNDKQTGPGRPDDPGAHGRDNAAEKQRQNPGKGSKGGEDWEDRLRDSIDDDDDRKDKDKDKDRDQDRDKDKDKDKDKEKDKEKEKDKGKNKGGKNKS